MLTADDMTPSGTLGRKESETLDALQPIRTVDLDEVSAATWDAVVPEDRRTPMNLRVWSDISLKSYGVRDKSKIILVGDAERPEALIPLMRRRDAIGWYSLLGNEGGGVEIPRRSEAAIPAIARALIGFGAPITLGDYPAHSPLIPALRDEARGRALVLTRPLPGLVKPWLNLDTTWTDPSQHLKKKTAQSIRRRERRLTELGKLETAFLTPSVSDVDALLDTALAIEASGWKSRAGVALATDPQQESFFRFYCRTLAEHGRLHLTFLDLDGKSIAMSIGELYGGTYWAHKTAYDEDYRKYAPGILKQFYLLRELAGKGVSRIDFQGRLDDFKRTWTDQGVEATKVRIYPFNPRGALALACDAGRQAGSMWTARRPT